MVLFCLFSFIYAEEIELTIEGNNLKAGYKNPSVNNWDIAFYSSYYGSENNFNYLTSKEKSNIVHQIDFNKKTHYLEFYVDNRNPTGLNSYIPISLEENKSYITLHIAGDTKITGLSQIISPSDYDPRKFIYVDYNTAKRIVIKFVMPTEYTDQDIFKLGLRVKSSSGENKQILLSLVSVYVAESKQGFNLNQNIIYIVGGVISIFIIFIIVMMFRSSKPKRRLTL
ncbi:MAG: hypothetical protein HRU03_01680 [Nanoarchaeales archaeon]|nr:hypothetical protein [Nanoarchaeales archaeon]